MTMMSKRSLTLTSKLRSSSAEAAFRSSDQPPGSSKSRQGDEKTDSAEVREAVAPGAKATSTALALELGRADRKGKTSSKKLMGNELSHLIPGYTAPMRLEANALKGIVGASLAELRNRAARCDSATYSPSISILNKREETFDPSVAAKKIKTPSSIAIQKKSGSGGKIPTSFSSSFRKAPRKRRDATAGAGWFGMNPTPMTDQLKTDLNIIRNRNYLDPKKFYKSAESFEGKVLQVGTVIEGSSEFYSSRLVKRDRRQNLTEEIMADANVASYAKRKYNDLQMERAKPKKRISKRGRKRR